MQRRETSAREDRLHLSSAYSLEGLSVKRRSATCGAAYCRAENTLAREPLRATAIRAVGLEARPVPPLQSRMTSHTAAWLAAA